LCWQRLRCDAGDKITHIANLHTGIEAACQENDYLRLTIGRLREELDEVQRYFKMRENDLRRTEEERNTHHSAAEHKAKKVEQLRVALHGKDGELQQERTALGEVRSQITLKDTTLTEAQARAERERMALEDAQARLAQAEQKAQEVEGLAKALKEKSDALAAVEGQLGEERTARERAESQLQIAREELGGARNALQERDTSIRQLKKDVDVVRAALENEKMRAKGKSCSSSPLVFCKVLSRLDICCHAAELQKSSANPSKEMRVLQVAYDEAQGELKNLETAALDVCRELEGAEGQSSGSSLASRLRSLGRLVTERLRGTLRLGVQKALGLTSSHYKLNFTLLLDGYLVPEDVVGEEAELEAVRKVDASMADNAAALADMFEVDLFPDVAEGEAAASPSPRAP
jgi:DNA repair exonuclease SbcCD ATPase subunit